MAKNYNRDKTLSSIADYDDKISKCEAELKNLEYKRQTLLARTIEAEMKMRNLDLSYFYGQMDKYDKDNEKSDKAVKSDNVHADEKNLSDVKQQK
ncbi:MAG: hypothetical protein IJ583_15020 [Firmicutes bacterium]|nr:hypothetical protein [Bacillota bacterium]